MAVVAVFIIVFIAGLTPARRGNNLGGWSGHATVLQDKTSHSYPLVQHISCLH
jgi:hypothetical protein